jgi:hypothetical protein
VPTSSTGLVVRADEAWDWEVARGDKPLAACDKRDRHRRLSALGNMWLWGGNRFPKYPFSIILVF